MARNGSHGDDYRCSQFCNDYDSDHDDIQLDRLLGNSKSGSRYTISSPLPRTSGAFRKLSPPPVSGLGFIEHPVSKLDTLAGVAIKYGVEVADIKRMNGLITDLQMFALKTLHIPLPGRHPPTSCLSSGSDTPGQGNFKHAPHNHGNCDLIDSFQPLRSKSSPQKVSPAMISLQGFYGLRPAGTSMAYIGLNGDSPYSRDNSYLEPAPACNVPLSRHRKSRSLVNNFLQDSNEAYSNLYLGDATASDSDKLVRRRPKSVTDFTCSSQDMLMKEESNTGAILSAITGKGLAQRSKVATRFSIPTDAEAGDASHVQIGTTGCFAADGVSGFRKSSSTSNLQNEDGPGIWPTYWKPDLQALSAAAITKPIYDGLPKPATSRRNKAALD